MRFLHQMPIEVAQLKDQPCPLPVCPLCQVKPFAPFMRGQVQRSQRWLNVGWRRPYCALICSSCYEVVGWEWGGPPVNLSDC